MALYVDIEKRLGDFHLRVKFEAGQEILGLLGASGCGKSQTLQCIAGIQRPDRGRIVLNGRVLFDSEQRIDLPPQKRRVGYLFQQYALFPNMTVEENILAGAQGETKQERMECAKRQIAAFQLEGLEKLRPYQLSGGQQQRTALARIFANEPELLLLDEPFSALDGYLKWQLELELAQTLKSFSGGVVFVSHNRDEVYRLCDTVCVLAAGKSDAKLTTRELFRAPSTVGAAQISGCKNITPAHFAAGEGVVCPAWGVTLQTALPVHGGITHVGIRSHDLRPTVTENPIPVTVEQVIDNLFSTVVMVRTPGGGRLRLELEKAEWAALDNPTTLTVYVSAQAVMPLTE